MTFLIDRALKGVNPFNNQDALDGKEGPIAKGPANANNNPAANEPEKSDKPDQSDDKKARELLERDRRARELAARNLDFVIRHTMIDNPAAKAEKAAFRLYGWAFGFIPIAVLDLINSMMGNAPLGKVTKDFTEQMVPPIAEGVKLIDGALENKPSKYLTPREVKEAERIIQSLPEDSPVRQGYQWLLEQSKRFDEAYSPDEESDGYLNNIAWVIQVGEKMREVLREALKGKEHLERIDHLWVKAMKARPDNPWGWIMEKMKHSKGKITYDLPVPSNEIQYLLPENNASFVSSPGSNAAQPALPEQQVNVTYPTVALSAAPLQAQPSHPITAEPIQVTMLSNSAALLNSSLVAYGNSIEVANNVTKPSVPALQVSPMQRQTVAINLTPAAPSTPPLIQSGVSVKLTQQANQSNVDANKAQAALAQAKVFVKA